MNVYDIIMTLLLFLLFLAASGLGKKEWGLPALEQAVIAAMSIKDFASSSQYLQKLALDAAVMGYVRLAKKTAQLIVDTTIFGDTLIKINKITGQNE